MGIRIIHSNTGVWFYQNLVIHQDYGCYVVFFRFSRLLLISLSMRKSISINFKVLKENSQEPVWPARGSSLQTWKGFWIVTWHSMTYTGCNPQLPHITCMIPSFSYLCQYTGGERGPGRVAHTSNPITGNPGVRGLQANLPLKKENKYIKWCYLKISKPLWCHVDCIAMAVEMKVLKETFVSLPLAIQLLQERTPRNRNFPEILLLAAGNAEAWYQPRKLVSWGKYPMWFWQVKPPPWVWRWAKRHWWEVPPQASTVDFTSLLPFINPKLHAKTLKTILLGPLDLFVPVSNVNMLNKSLFFPS